MCHPEKIGRQRATRPATAMARGLTECAPCSLAGSSIRHFTRGQFRSQSSSWETPRLHVDSSCKWENLHIWPTCDRCLMFYDNLWRTNVRVFFVVFFKSDSDHVHVHCPKSDSDFSVSGKVSFLFNLSSLFSTVLSLRKQN